METMDNKVRISGSERIGFEVTKGDKQNPTYLVVDTDSDNIYSMDAVSINQAQDNYYNGLNPTYVEVKEFASEQLAIDAAKKVWGQDIKIQAKHELDNDNSQENRNDHQNATTSGEIPENVNNYREGAEMDRELKGEPTLGSDGFERDGDKESRFSIFGDKVQGFMPVREKFINGKLTETLSLKPSIDGRPTEFNPHYYTDDLYPSIEAAVLAASIEWGVDIGPANGVDLSNIDTEKTITELSLPQEAVNSPGKTVYEIWEKDGKFMPVETFRFAQAGDLSLDSRGYKVSLDHPEFNNAFGSFKAAQKEALKMWDVKLKKADIVTIPKGHMMNGNSYVMAEKNGQFIPMKEERIAGQVHYTTIQQAELGPQAFSLAKHEKIDFSKGFADKAAAEQAGKDRWGEDIKFENLKMNDMSIKAVIFEKAGKFVPRLTIKKEGRTKTGSLYEKNGDPVIALDKPGEKPKIDFNRGWQNFKKVMMVIKENFTREPPQIKRIRENTWQEQKTIQQTKAQTKSLGSAAQRLQQQRQGTASGNIKTRA